MRPLTCCLLLFSCGLLHGGDLTRRQELTLDRVLDGGPPRYTDEFLLADVIPQPGRRFTNFSGDLSGRYIEALAAWSLQTGQNFTALDRVARQVLGQQKPDGHFGNPMSASAGAGGGVTGDDMARMWGNGRLLVGLVEYYRLSKQPQVLDAARRLGDFFMAEAPLFNSDAVMRQYTGAQVATGYICWTQNVEGLAGLYQLTGDSRYRQLADQLAAKTFRYPSQHSHGFLTLLRGILLLYEATREKKYLDQVEAEWKALADSENLLVQGAIPEVLSPGIERDEGCSEADWLRLSLQLWKVTGKQPYLEQAEHAYFNEFSFNQFASGDFGHHKFLAAGIDFENARAWWCCTLHGLRALADIIGMVFRTENGVLFYDLPLDARTQTPGRVITASSLPEKDGSVKITAKSGRFRLAIRQPAWADSVQAAIGGRPVTGEAKAGYLYLSRELRPGETVEIRYGMKTRAVASPALVLAGARPGQRPGTPGQARDTKMAAIFCGPWLLGVNERVSPHFFDEPYSANQRLLVGADENGNVRLERAPAAGPGTAPFSSRHAGTRAAAPSEAAFSVPMAHRSVEYVPGGYALQQTAVTLAPIAEKTAADPPARWQFLFRLQ